LGFIAVGWTGGFSSRRFIGRYKSLEELRDVFKLDRLTSAVSRGSTFSRSAGPPRIACGS
jgi:hypothetical protein